MRTWILALGMLVALSACDEEGVRARREPKAPAAPASPTQPQSSSSDVTWTLPPGWQSVPGSQPMRLATFRTGDGSPEVSLSVFPADTGGLLANINRWRNQLKLPPIEEAQLPQAVQASVDHGVRVALTHITGGENGQEMLGAIIVPGDGKTWFVKATSAAGPIAKLEPAFDAFAHSFKLNAAPAAAAPDPAPPSADSVQTRLSAWTPPSHWHKDPAASSIVAAAYNAESDAGGAKVTATVLPTDGGGLLANINRWRGQLGLPELASPDDQPKTDLGRGNVLVDLASLDNSRRMIAAVISSPGETWFFKLTGTPRAVEAERPHFDRLVHAVGLGEGAAAGSAGGGR